MCLSQHCNITVSKLLGTLNVGYKGTFAVAVLFFWQLCACRLPNISYRETTMSGEDSGETGWTSDFVLPIVLFFTSYVVLAFGYFVDRCCLYDWHQRRKQELEEMEEAAVRRALEESDDAYISLDSISFGKSIKNLEPFYVFVWLAVALTAVDLFLWYHAFSSWEGPGNDTLANAALALVVGMCFHTVCMPLVLLGKICDWRPSRVSDCCASKPRKPVDHEGRRFTLFSMKLDPGTKVSQLVSTPPSH